jgi:hypothetical protein
MDEIAALRALIFGWARWCVYCASAQPFNFDARLIGVASKLHSTIETYTSWLRKSAHESGKKEAIPYFKPVRGRNLYGFRSRSTPWATNKIREIQKSCYPGRCNTNIMLVFNHLARNIERESKMT